MKRVLIITGLLLTLTFTSCWSQNYFQNNRKAFQKARYKKTTTKFGSACEIFEKKRTKGERKPLINLGLGRRGKKKVAEAD